MPNFLLQKYILQQFPEGEREAAIADSIDFMVAQVDTLTQAEVASRLTLTCTPGPLRPTDFERIDTSNVTIIDVRPQPRARAHTHAHTFSRSLSLSLSHVLRTLGLVASVAGRGIAAREATQRRRQVLPECPRVATTIGRQLPVSVAQRRVQHVFDRTSHACTTEPAPSTSALYAYSARSLTCRCTCATMACSRTPRRLKAMPAPRRPSSRSFSFPNATRRCLRRCSSTNPRSINHTMMLLVATARPSVSAFISHAIYHICLS